MDARTRVSLAERVRAVAAAVAEDVTDRFLERHPDWLARYGARARVLGIEDAQYHVTFLAGAIESGTTAAFADYARWTARVLEARGIARTFVGENLAQVRDALTARLPADAQATVAEFAGAALDALSTPEQQQEAVDAEAGRLALPRSLYLQSVLAGERRAALTIVTEALREGASPVDVYVDVLQSTLYEVGRLWETNQITVAHEHAATRGTLLISGLEGEFHSVGGLMVSDVLETRGWTVHFLGTNLPQKAILDAIRERQPQCVGITATMLFNLPAVRRLIEAVRSEWGPSKRIVLGGGAFRHSPGLWRELGADGYARDVRDAVGLMCQ